MPDLGDPLYVYETGQDWIPDDTYINSPQSMIFLAWRLGTDSRRIKNLWLIASINADPVPALETLLPMDAIQYEFTDDVIRYGHLRTGLPGTSVQDIQEGFLDELDKIKTDQDAGYR